MAVAYVDSFGNLKTTLRQQQPEAEELRQGEVVQITLNGTTETPQWPTAALKSSRANSRWHREAAGTNVLLETLSAGWFCV